MFQFDEAERLTNAGMNGLGIELAVLYSSRVEYRICDILLYVKRVEKPTLLEKDADFPANREKLFFISCVVISWPNTWILPESGFKRPEAVFSRTDFPLPAAPKRMHV